MPGANRGWISIADNGVKQFHIQSTTKPNVTYIFTINPHSERMVFCSCPGFQSTGRCKHTEFYKNITAQLIKDNGFTEKVIRNFKSAEELVKDICEEDPDCIGNYNRLDENAKRLHELGKAKLYQNTTLHRAFRLLVAREEIEVPENVRIRRFKTEGIMHDINKWSPSPSDSDYNQSKLIEEET